AWQWRATQPQWRDALASARGQLLERGLADGSRVWLDADGKAMLAYYADRREARLDRGQAMFSIARDPERPFIVEAGPLRVRVLGTRFAVRNLSGRVEVAVAHGRVEVAEQGGEGRKWLLTDGQRAVWRDGELRPDSPVAPASVGEWRTGRLAFSNRPLAEVLAEFERYGPTGLRLARPALGRLRLSGSFASHDAAAFARALPGVLPVALRRVGETMVIEARAPGG
ncbi:FecR family protein, partial [Chromobacterium phragmitis]